MEARLVSGFGTGSWGEQLLIVQQMWRKWAHWALVIVAKPSEGESEENDADDALTGIEKIT